MTQFSRRSQRPQAQPAVDGHASADAGAQREERHRPRRSAVAEDQFAECRHAHVVEEVDGAADFRCEHIAHGHVTPLGGKIGQELGDAVFQIDQPRNAHAERGGLAATFRRQVLDQFRDARQHGLRALVRLRRRFLFAHDASIRAGKDAGDVGPAQVHACIDFSHRLQTSLSSGRLERRMPQSESCPAVEETAQCRRKWPSRGAVRVPRPSTGSPAIPRQRPAWRWEESVPDNPSRRKPACPGW